MTLVEQEPLPAKRDLTSLPEEDNEDEEHGTYAFSDKRLNLVSWRREAGGGIDTGLGAPNELDEEIDKLFVDER